MENNLDTYVYIDSTVALSIRLSPLIACVHRSNWKLACFKSAICCPGTARNIAPTAFIPANSMHSSAADLLAVLQALQPINDFFRQAPCPRYVHRIAAGKVHY
jgi:hypothetical protein